MIFEKHNVGTHDTERITIKGTTAILEEVGNGQMWRHKEFDIIKCFGHKTVKDYIQHLKYFDYKQID